MKIKNVFIGLTIVLCLMMATGCGNSENEKKEEVPGKIGETVVYEDVAYTVTGVEKSSGSEYDQPKEGKVFVIVSLTIENRSDGSVSYNPFDYKMLNSQGQMHDTTFTTVNSATALNSGDLIQGGSVSGTLSFEEDANDSQLMLCKYNSFSEKSYFKIQLY